MALDIMFIILLAAAYGSAQMLELPIQDHVPKMIVPDCPNTPYPVVMSSMNSLELMSNQYLVCLRGVPLIFNCSEGLFFNPDRLTCEFPYERRSILSPTDQEIPDLSQYPVPINPDRRIPEGPITRPDPDVIEPLPVQPLPSQGIVVPYRRHLDIYPGVVPYRRYLPQPYPKHHLDIYP